jgi:hypothetical protein
MTGPDDDFDHWLRRVNDELIDSLDCDTEADLARLKDDVSPGWDLALEQMLNRSEGHPLHDPGEP